MLLIVEEGYNRGEVHELGPGATTIGRDAACQLQLLDASVSRQHAQLVREGDALRLRDLGSHNGTRLNGVPVDDASVGSGDRIAIGVLRLLVLAPGAGSAGAAAGRPTRSIDGRDALEPGDSGRPGPDPDEPLGESAPVRELLRRVARVAPSTATVLVLGETGAGKELVARAVHRLSERRRGPFVAINCAALQPALAESELFGHEKGAFSGALARKLGLAEAAHGGTLFLDEVGELEPAVQAKLLRFLERGEVLRVGATAPVVVDVRLVAATNRDLEARVREGAFREDLLHRLRVVELAAPPLRERGDDVLLLARAFLERAAPRRRLSSGAEALLRAYAWPGNVRELKNVIEAAALFMQGDELVAADLPERLSRVPSSGGAKPGADDGDDEPFALREVERRAILRALERCQRHRTRTAELLGIDRKTLYRKLEELGLDR